jgi:uncharacterized membrane protein
MDWDRVSKYALFFTLFVLAQSLSMVGQYITLPYKHLTYFQTLQMGLPWCIADWAVMPFVIRLGHEHKLVTPLQDVLLLMAIQFTLVLIINRFYLHQLLTISDIVAFFVICAGFYVSFRSTGTDDREKTGE